MPRIFVIRHAEAEDSDTGGNDGARRLTERGRERAAAAAGGLHQLAGTLSLIAHSPLVRAVETAKVVARLYPEAVLYESPALLPTAAPAELFDWLKQQNGDLAVVGHEPMLSHWIGYAVTGKFRAIVQMKKLSTCALEMDYPLIPGHGHIQWLMTWRQLTGRE